MLLFHAKQSYSVNFTDKAHSSKGKARLSRGQKPFLWTLPEIPAAVILLEHFFTVLYIRNLVLNVQIHSA